jgi:hypothetical protein
MRNRKTLIRWLREEAQELEDAHRILDELGAPDQADDGTPISLALRIAVLHDSERRGVKSKGELS